MLLSVNQSQLVLIDYQTRLMPAIADADDVLANALRLANAATLLHVPGVRTEQSPEQLGATVPALMPFEFVCIEKTCFDACQAGLAEHLRSTGLSKVSSNAKSLPKHLQKPVQLQRNAIVLAGVEAHICLLQTALTLLEEDDWDVYVVVDACSSRTHRSRDAAFDRLASAGAELLTTEMVIYEWLADAQHPQFKPLLAHIK